MVSVVSNSKQSASSLPSLQINIYAFSFREERRSQRKPVMPVRTHLMLNAMNANACVKWNAPQGLSAFLHTQQVKKTPKERLRRAMSVKTSNSSSSPASTKRQLHLLFPPKVFILLLVGPSVVLDAQVRDVVHAPTTAGHHRGGGSQGRRPWGH